MHIFSAVVIKCNVILPSANTSLRWHLNIHAFLAEEHILELLSVTISRPLLTSVPHYNQFVENLLKSIFVLYVALAVFGLSSFICNHRRLTQPPAESQLSCEGGGLWVSLKDGLMDRRFFLTFLLCSVSWILFWEVRWKKGKESQIEEWLQGHSLSQYGHLFEGESVTSPFDVWVRMKQINALCFCPAPFRGFCRNIMDERHA